MQHLSIALLFAGCAEYSMADRAFSDTDTGVYDPATGGEPEPPPGAEVENDFLGQRPATTDEYVFIANTARHTVSRVRASDQGVVTVDVGFGPSIIHTSADGAFAVTFNQLEDSVSLVHAESMEVRTVEVRENFNTMEITPDGAFALLWHDVLAESDDDPIVTGVQSYNEVSVVELASGQHTAMAVGFNPRDVAFTDNGRLGVVVSDDALAIIDFGTSPPPVPVIVPLSNGFLDLPDAEEVALAPDGGFAYVRRFGTSTLQAVNLRTAEVLEIEVGAGLTDMDVSPDGDDLVLVCREARELWLLDARDPLADMEVVPFPVDLSLGALTIAPDGERAIVYTTASLVDRYFLFDVRERLLTPRPLIKPASAVSFAPNSRDVLVIHTREDADGAELGPFFGEWALTMIDLDLGLPTPFRLPAAPLGFANGEGDLAYFIMEGQPYFEVLDYRSRLYTEVALRSEPVWVGALPDYAWVSQEHPLGRISFYDPASEVAETLTGFELNAAIED